MRIGKVLTGTTARILFLCILISPLYAESFSEPQTDEGSPDEGLLFFEEFFIFEETFSFNEALKGEETLPVNEDIPGEETFLSDEVPPVEEIPPDKETFLAKETFMDPQPGLQGEDSPLDDNAFFFESPPLIFEVPTFEIRSLDVLFPYFTRRQKRMAVSNTGLRHFLIKDEPVALIPNPDLEIDLLGSIMKKNPSHLIEALVVVPYNEKELDLLDIYNALGRIEKIKDHPASFNGGDLYVFTESTRIESARNRRSIPDPLSALTLPFSDTMYIRLKEINLGNLFIRGDISISMYGITYSMTNFTDIRYFFLPIMKAERFTTMIYLEPIKEGILIYSMSGFYLPGFIADRVNLTPNINRRIEIFVNWITDGLREQENAGPE